jgi:hypothetical protein
MYVQCPDAACHSACASPVEFGVCYNVSNTVGTMMTYNARDTAQK